MSNILEEVITKGNVNELELRKMILDKKSKYKQLLNDEMAAFLIAKELGIPIDDVNTALTPLNIIDEQSKNINILVNVKQIFDKKEYDGAKKGYFYNIIVYDNTNELTLTLWNIVPNFVVDDLILIKSLYTSKFKDKIKLNTSATSEIIVKGHKDVTQTKKLIKDVGFGDKNIDVTGVVTNKYDLKEFEYNGVMRQVIKVILYDENYISLSVWGDLAKMISEIPTNSKIEVTQCYVKNNNGRKEINTSDNSKINILEHNVILDIMPKRKQITNLAYDDKSEIEVNLKELIRSFNVYICKNCGTKMELKDTRFFCSKCGDFTPADKKVVLVYKVFDESGETSAVFFTKSAYILLDADETNIDDKINNFNDFTKKILLTGNLKKTQYGDEFVVAKVNRGY